MRFELSKELLLTLSTAVEEGNVALIKKIVEDLHVADIAEIFDSFSVEQAIIVFRLLKEDVASDVLAELDDDSREKLLTSLTAKEIAGQLEHMDSDDATDVIQDLPEDRVEQVIAEIEDVDQASDIVDLLTYPENSAGGIMAKEFICVNVNWTISICIREMRRQAQELKHVYTIYVVNDQSKLIGRFSMKALLFASPRTLVKEIYVDEIKSVEAEAPAEEVARLMSKYDLVVLPVVSNSGTLLGRITIDDAVDVIQEEADKDLQMASGISENVESKDSVWRLSRARLPWLLIGLAGGLLGAQVIGLFEHKIELFPEMAAFIPLIAAMGGNVGVQASAIIVQALAADTLDTESTGTKLLKELAVACLNGLACSSAILIFMYIVGYSINLSGTIAVALMSVIIVSGLFGTMIPLALNRYKIDPALATGPFITTVNDVFGLLLYFLIGALIYF